MDTTKSKIRCLVVDDEPLAVKLISSHIQQIDAMEIVASCKNALQALDILRKEPVDLMFLDIHMPQISGLDFLRSLTHPPKVILTTAYREYALEGFELDVVDYLLKPISFERFLKSVNKYFERMERPLLFHAEARPFPEDDFIMIRDNKTHFKILLKDILYIEAFGEYMKIHTSGKVHLSRETMHEMEEKLPHAHFLRIHKSFLVPVQKITAFTAFSVYIQEQEIPVGRSYKDTVSKVLAG
ncbi:MAG: LytTR family DNA-binding domain-containing protein [Bacteroidetes bacterium]|nr:LytTR family DNA-binding domain-containing protein [Bacteroidota bacterium]